MTSLLHAAEVLACAGAGGTIGWFAGFVISDFDNAIVVMPTCALIGAVVGVSVGVVVFT